MTDERIVTQLPLRTDALVPPSKSESNLNLHTFW
jgi:hypothetical protein